MLLLLKLRRYWREGAIAVLAIGLFLAVLQVRRERIQAGREKVVYTNPATSAATFEKKSEAAIKRKTTSEERPDGTKLTTVDEEIGPVETVKGTDSTSRPVPLAEVMTPHRSDRWLLAVQVDDARFRDAAGYTGLVGYGWRNRVDLLAGWGGDGGKLMVVARF